MESYKVIGLMSGTSLDGLDICYAEYSLNNTWQHRIIHATTIAYNNELKNKLQDCIVYTSEQLSKLDTELGEYWGSEVRNYIVQNNLNVDFISSHGHTVFHQPHKGITKQIGCAKRLSKLTGLKVVSDFRTNDVNLGGQGAPLVPIGDKHLFSEYDYCVNLGGISNVSYDDNTGIRRAFDISPCNLILNYLSEKVGKEYDDGGRMAKKGKLSASLLKELNKQNYYSKKHPKSLGKEDIENVFKPILESVDVPLEDKLNTFCEHIGFQIGKCLDAGQTLITGGGVFNDFLVDCIQKNTNSEVVVTNELTSSFKEALIFGFLGVLKIRGDINILKSYTGASEDSSSGTITEYC